MKRLTRPFALALLLAVAAPAFAQNWTQVRSPNFTVITDAGAGQGRETALRFEQMRGLFAAIFRRTKVNLPVPLTIIAFRNSKGLRDNAPFYNGKPIELAGFFQKGEDRNFIALDLSAPNAWDTVFHEYAHLLLNSNYPATQPWFDEGFAEYYSSLKIGGKEIEIGSAPKSYSILTEQPRLMPIVDLFSVAQDSRVYNESGNRRSLFYAQSWLVVHWIFDNKKLPETARYFDLVMNRKVPIPEAITQAFGMDPRQFDRQLSDYMRLGRGNIARIPLPVDTDPGAYTANKINDVEARAVIADLHLHMRDRRDQAVAEFQEVLQASPENETAHKGLGFHYVWKRDFERARPHLERAVDLKSRDARVYYYLAVLMNHGLQNAASNAGGVQSTIYQLQKALDLDPEYADAYNLMGFLQLQAGRTGEAVKNMSQAVALSPRNDFYRLNLAQMFIANNQLEDAKNLLALLQNSPESSIAQQAAGIRSGIDVVAQRQKQWSEQGLTSYKDPTDPRWLPKERQDSIEAEQKPVAEEKPDTRKIEYVKGTLVRVNCADPGATVTISSGGKSWTFRTPDYKKLLLIGADDFNCEWKNVQASVNYKRSGPNQGDLVSLEVN